MYSYVTAELPALVAAHFPMADMTRQGIFGHSMGGHGALVAALKNPGPLPQLLRLRADRASDDGGMVTRRTSGLSRPR